MTTTNTIVARLLARAEEYEQRAAGLRLAAEEFSGEQLLGKKNGIHRQLAAASELRVEQKNGGPAADDGMNQPERKALRMSIVTEYLQANGSQRMVEITKELQRRGHKISRDRVRQIVHEMPNVEKQVVEHSLPLWSLKSANGDGAPAIAGILERSKSKKKQTRKKRTPTVVEARLEKARIVCEILKEAGVPLSTQELSAAARQRDIVEITGIHNYAKRGWIKMSKRNGKTRYSFGEMPPAADAASTSA